MTNTKSRGLFHIDACNYDKSNYHRIVYVLELEDNCFYIGYTNHPKERLDKHFNGGSAIWTKFHHPIMIVEMLEVHSLLEGLKVENQVTNRYIKKYGVKKVRGGGFTQTTGHYYDYVMENGHL